MVKPNFIVIGAQKTATSWLRSMLRQHPQIFFAENEIRYFSNPDNYAKGSDWYLSHFENAGQAIAIGEKSPSYMQGNPDDQTEIPRKMHQLVPDAKLIALLRNPVERAISGINHAIMRGRVPRDVDLSIAVPQYIEEKARHIRSGYYYDILNGFYQFYDPARVLVLIYEEDVVEHPTPTLANICQFLGVDAAVQFADTEKQVNAPRLSARGVRLANQVLGRSKLAVRLISKLEKQLGLAAPKVRPDAATLDLLYNLYAEPNGQLFTLLRRDIPSWSKANAYITR